MKGFSLFQHCSLLRYNNNFVCKKFYSAWPWTVVGVSGDTISFNNQLDTYEESVVDKFKSNLLLMIFWWNIINYNS